MKFITLMIARVCNKKEFYHEDVIAIHNCEIKLKSIWMKII